MAESEEKPINNQTTENLEGDNSVPNGPNNDAAGASEDLANDDEKANNEKEELEEEEEEEEEEEKKKKRAYRRNAHLVKVELPHGWPPSQTWLLY